MEIENVINVIFGSSGVVAYISARRERKMLAKITEASALEGMQKNYAQYVVDTNIMYEELKTRMQEFENALNKYRIQCKNCENNKLE